jgi:chemotaxis protein MotB
MAKGGGAWKVAYADFVTAMMAFFMVMWLVNQKPEVRAAIAEHFRNPSGKLLTGNPHNSIIPPDSRGSGGKKNRSKSKDDETKQTKMSDEGSRTNVGTVVPFSANSVALDDTTKQQIDALLPDLIGKPNMIEVRGHAIDDSIGGAQACLDAIQISYQRTLATWKYLIEKGIEPERLRLSQAGSSEPFFVGVKEDASRAARVEIYLLKDIYEESHAKSERLISLQNAAKTAEPPPPTPEELAAKEKSSHGH